jgi:hypothetical protein
VPQAESRGSLLVIARPSASGAPARRSKARPASPCQPHLQPNPISRRLPQLHVPDAARLSMAKTQHHGCPLRPCYGAAPTVWSCCGRGQWPPCRRHACCCSASIPACCGACPWQLLKPGLINHACMRRGQIGQEQGQLKLRQEAEQTAGQQASAAAHHSAAQPRPSVAAGRQRGSHGR